MLLKVCIELFRNLRNFSIFYKAQTLVIRERDSRRKISKKGKEATKKGKERGKGWETEKGKKRQIGKGREKAGKGKEKRRKKEQKSITGLGPKFTRRFNT